MPKTVHLPLRWRRRKENQKKSESLASGGGGGWGGGRNGKEKQGLFHWSANCDDGQEQQEERSKTNFFEENEKRKGFQPHLRKSAITSEPLQIFQQIFFWKILYEISHKSLSKDFFPTLGKDF